MKTTREQFEAQKQTAQQTANFYKKPLHLVIVRRKNTPDTVSIIGNAINPAAIEIWRNKGARVRIICKIKPS